MGCCVSSPHARRVYRDPADYDEIEVPLRYFGKYRSGSGVQVPDDIDGLPSTHILEHNGGFTEPYLYEAEIDHGYAFRCLRPLYIICMSWPHYWIAVLAYGGIARACRYCNCDQACLWTRKEYSTRNWYRVYGNRIEVNQPLVRIPWGCLGCGSWNADDIETHPFDRGAFGFRPVPACDVALLCCLFPVYGGVIARQRCQCNGPLWQRMRDCGGWWCDEWPCGIFFCSYNYSGLANPEETSFASNIALQAYFEGRNLKPEEMHRCLDYWRENLSEKTDPEGRKRDVCCEPYYIPCPSCTRWYQCTHPKRDVPYAEDDERNTPEIKEVYKDYDIKRLQQIEAWKTYYGPVKSSTLCRTLGCKRFCGRNGFIFCFEGCCSESHKAGEPAPPFDQRDIDDENDASVVLRKVLGNPPANVVYKRWEFNDQGETTLVTRGPGLVAKHQTINSLIAEGDEEEGLVPVDLKAHGE